MNNIQRRESITAPRLKAIALVISSLVILSGCFEDTAIRSYTVAKTQASQPGDAQGQPAQLLGVIVPHEASAWFLKLTDDPEKVQTLAGDFRELANSLTFDGDGTPQWKLAQGWEERVLKQLTYAQFSSSDGALVTLTQLGADTQDPAKWQVYLKDNINRWRQQLGLSPQEWPDMEQELEEVPTHSTKSAKAYFVSLVGQQSAASGPMGRISPPMISPNSSGEPSDTLAPSSSDSPSPPAAALRPRLVYKVPEGWQEQPSSGIRLALFQISADSNMATVSVSTAGGQLEQSVSMWMQQVGLEPAEEQVSKIIESAESGTSTLGDYQCYTIEGNSPEQELPANAIRVAIIPLSDQENLFIKLTGNKDLVANETERFGEFLKSLSWQ